MGSTDLIGKWFLLFERNPNASNSPLEQHHWVVKVELSCQYYSKKKLNFRKQIICTVHMGPKELLC